MLIDIIPDGSSNGLAELSCGVANELFVSFLLMVEVTYYYDIVMILI